MYRDSLIDSYTSETFGFEGMQDAPVKASTAPMDAAVGTRTWMRAP